MDKGVELPPELEDPVDRPRYLLKGLVWSFSIPPKTAYNPDPVDGAEFVNGLLVIKLRVELPEEQRPRKIEINSH